MTVTAPEHHSTRTGNPRSPRASRLRPPSWRDPRLLVGLILVTGSVVLGSKVVYANTDTELFYVAGRTLTPGMALTEADLHRVAVNLTDAAQHYLSVDQALAPGATAVRTVNAGELISQDAVGTAAEVAVRPISVPISHGSATARNAGDIVDIWVADQDPANPGAFAEPRTVVTSAIVAEVNTDAARFGAAGAAMTTVLVPQKSVPLLLKSVANEAQIALIPVMGAQPCSK